MNLAAALALLFFAPLAVVYARHVARGLHRRRAARDASLLSASAGRLLGAGFVALALAVAIPGREAILPALPGWLSGNGGARLVLFGLDEAGGVALILFFLSIPYVLGSLIGVAAAAAGLWTPPPFTIDGGPIDGGPVDGGGAEFQTADESGMEGRRVTGKTLAIAPLTIAIDGPAAAGKGTLAEKLAAHYGLPYLDTGLLYRAVGKLAASRFIDPDDARATAEIARRLDTRILDDGTLRGREAGELASRVAVHPEVRAALEAFQRDFAGRPEGAVLDGRDIGTVICPGASVKIFVTASPEVRARRRTDELLAKGREATYERILAEVRERDARDAGRAVAPLRAADDAHLLDTSEMDIATAFQAACGLIDRFLVQRNGV